MEKNCNISKAYKVDCEVIPSPSTLQTYSRVSNESVPASRIKVRFQIFHIKIKEPRNRNVKLFF